jgi:hypothetical protein
MGHVTKCSMKKINAEDLTHKFGMLHLLILRLHHLHLLGVLLNYLRVNEAFCRLPGSGVTHDHVIHHVGERVLVEAATCLSVWLACATSHRFVKHFTLENY